MNRSPQNKPLLGLVLTALLPVLAGSMPGHSQQETEALTVQHDPNPVDGRYSEASSSYRWVYQTAVKNNLTIPLKISRFGSYCKENDQWVLRTVNGLIFTGKEFTAWYTGGDSLADGWILPGNTAIVRGNWFRWSDPIPPAVKWVYTAVDSQENEYHAEGEIKLNPAPVPVLHGSILFPEFYKYKVGDDTSWAQPDLDDRDWEKRPNPSLYPQAAWAGIRWLRLVLEVDSALQDVPLGFSLNCRGAVEIYLNGKLLQQYGKVGNSRDEEIATTVIWYPRPRVISFPAQPSGEGFRPRYIIAIRHSSYFLDSPHWTDVGPDLTFAFGNMEEMSTRYSQIARKVSVHQMFLMGIFLAFALIHFLLFYYYPRLRANLYFALVSLLACLFAFLHFQDRFFVTTALSELWTVRLANTMIALLLLAILRLVYELVYQKAPGHFRYFMLLSAAFIVWNWFRPFQMETKGLILNILFFAEIVRVIVTVRIKRHRSVIDGSGIVFGGMIIVVATAVYQILAFDLRIITPIWQHFDFPALFYSGLALMFSMSIFLSRKFAHTNHELETRLIEVKTLSEQALQQERAQARLEADNARKTQELEEARELQLSMLPKSIPRLSHLEIAVYMQPATEVGGDYYDFNQEDDGTLTVAIGDATGHGLQAGTMVAATKSLFNAMARERDLVQILQTSSAALKAMGFRRLYMALAIAKFNGRRVQIAGAGMPHALIYRSRLKQIEETALKGMPLGSFPDFAYRQSEFGLEKDDVLLLLSDGLPEMFNEQQEELGDAAVKSIFAASARKSPEQIIQDLVAAGNRWAGDKPQADDVTLLAIKCIR